MRPIGARAHVAPRALPLTLPLRRTRALFALATASALLMGVAIAHGAQPEKSAGGDKPTVRLAYFPNLTHAAALVGVERGTFANALGPDANLDVRTFTNGPTLIEALFAGEVDVGYVGPNPAINGYVKSRGEALRVIAGASSGGALFVVRPDSNIDGPQDLAGKKFATPQLGGTQDVALRYYTQQHGLQTADKGGTVEIVPTAPADILTLFKTKRIDGAWVPEPWATRLVLEGDGKVFIDERDQWPDGKFVTTVIVARKAFLDQHPELVRAILGAHIDSVRFVQEQPEEAKRIINQEIQRITSKGLPAHVLDQALAHTDITWEPLPETLVKQADYAYALGFLGTKKPDLSGLYDLPLLQEALAERSLPRVAAR